MKKSRFSDAQIIGVLQEHEKGAKVPDLCRKLGVSDTRFFRWQKKFGGLGTSKLRERRQLKDENRKLRALVADLTLDRHMRQEVVRRTL